MWLFLLNNVIVAAIVLTLSYAGFSKLIAYGVRKACKVDTTILSLNVIEQTSISLLWCVFQETWRPLILQSPSMKATICVDPPLAATSNSPDDLLTAGVSQLRKHLLAWIDTRGHDTWFMSSMLFQIAFAFVTLMLSCVAVAVPSITLSLVDEAHELVKVEITNAALSVKSIWKHGKVHMSISVQLDFRVRSGGELLVYSDLKVQANLQPLTELRSMGRLPPPFCLNALSIQSTRFDVFPDPLLEATQLLDWTSFNIAPPPEGRQSNEDVVVGLGYIGALVEPTLEIGCATVASSKWLEQTRVCNLHITVKTKIQHKEAELLADHVLNATIPVDIGITMQAVEVGARKISTSENDLVSCWWKEFELGPEVENNASMCASNIEVITCFTWEVQLCSPNQPTLHLFRQHSYQQTSRLSSLNQIIHKIDVDGINVFCTAGQVHALGLTPSSIPLPGSIPVTTFLNQAITVAVHNVTTVVLCPADSDERTAHTRSREYEMMLVARGDEFSAALTNENEDILTVRLDTLRSYLGSKSAPAAYEWLHCSSTSMSVNLRSPTSEPVAVHLDQVRIGWCPIVLCLAVDLAAPFIQPSTIGQVFGARKTKAFDAHNKLDMDAIRATKILEGLTTALDNRRIGLDLSVNCIFASIPVAIENSFQSAFTGEFLEWYQGLMMRFAGLNPLRHILWEEHTITAKEIRVRTFDTPRCADEISVNALGTVSFNDGSQCGEGWALQVHHTTVARNCCGLANTCSSRVLRVQPSDGDVVLVANKFGMEQVGDIIDIVADGCRGYWNLSLQAWLWKNIMDVTFSVWTVLLRVRRLRHIKLLVDHYTVNAPLDDCSCLRDRYEEFLALITYCADTKHRLYATDIIIEAELVPESMKVALGDRGSLDPIKLTLAVQTFGGGDMPSDWVIEGLTLQDHGQTFVDLQYTSFTHTTGISSSVLLGDRWRELKTRYNHAMKSGWAMPLDEKTRQLLEAEEEFRIVLRGLEMKLVRSDTIVHQFPAIGKAVQTLLHSTTDLIPGRWTPDNENFKRLFRFAGFELYPQLRPQPANIPVSIILEDCVVSMEDDPMEAWLSTLRPIWMEEKTQQLMREEVFTQQKEAVLKSAPLAFAQEAIAIIEDKLQEINSQHYIERVTQVLGRHREVDVQRGFTCTAHGIPTLMRLQLDALRLNLRPAIEDIRHDHVSVDIKLMTSKLTTYLRGLHEPMLSINSIAMEGTTTVNTLMSAEQLKMLNVPFISLQLDHRLPAVEIPVAILPMTIYSNSSVSVEGVRLCYSPFLDFVLEDIFEMMSKAWSNTLSEFASPKLLQLPWWDIATGMLKMDAVVTVRDLEVFLLSTRHELHDHPGDFLAPAVPAQSSLPELEDQHNLLENMPMQNAFVLLSIDKLSTVISKGGFLVDLWSLKLHVRPTIVGLPALIELPFLSARIQLKWLYGIGNDDFGSQYSHAATDRTTALAAVMFTHLSANQAAFDIVALSTDLSNLLRSSGIELSVSAKISSATGSQDVFLDEQHLREQLHSQLWVEIPAAYYRSSPHAKFPGTSIVEPEISFSPSAHVGAASIMCFGPCLRPLLFWLDGYRAVSNLPFPRKGQNIIPRGIRAIRSHIQGLHLRPASFQQMDMFLYDRSPLDANSKGIRLAVKVGGEMMMSVQKEHELPDPFQTGKILIPDTVSATGCWCLSHAHFTVQDVEARLCTEATGSRGEFLMAADIVKVDTAANDLVPDTPLCPPTPNETGSFDGSGSEPDSEPIQLQAGIDVEHSDFLNSVLFDGLRIMITIDTRNALFDLLDSYYQLILDALPVSFKAPTELFKSQHFEDEGDKGLFDPNSAWFDDKPRDRSQSAPSQQSDSGSLPGSRSPEPPLLSQRSESKDDASASEPKMSVSSLSRRRANSVPDSVSASAPALEDAFADLPHVIRVVDDFIVYSPQQSVSQSRERAAGMLDATEVVNGQLMVEGETNNDSKIPLPTAKKFEKPQRRQEDGSVPGKLKALRYLRRSHRTGMATNKRLPITSHKLATVAQRLAQENVGLAAGVNSRRHFLSADELPEIFGLFNIRIHVAQVLMVDHTSRGSILAVLREAELQGSVGRTIEELLLTPPEQDNIRLQQLAHRKLQEYIETVSVRVDGFYLFVAPTDVDFSPDALWLPKAAIVPDSNKHTDDKSTTSGMSDIGATLLSHTASFRNQRSMYGVLKQVLEPAPISADVTILHTKIPQNSINTRLQDLKFTVNPAQLRIVRQVLTNIIASPLPSVEQRLTDEQTLYLLQQLQPDPKKIFGREDLALAWENTRHLEWSLQNKQHLLDNIHGVTLEAFTRHSDASSSPMASISARDSTSIWFDSLTDDVAMLRKDRRQYWDAIRVISKEIRRLHQIKPDVQFSINAGDLTLQLVYEDLPFAALTLREVTAEGISFERGSGQFELHIMTAIVTAKQHSADQSTGGAPGTSDQVLVVGSLFDHENIGKVVDRSTLATSSGQSYIARMLVEDSQTGESGELNKTQRPRVIRVLADVGEPVGGLPLIRHCELNIAPLVVFLTRGLISKFVVYFTEAMADVIAEPPQSSPVIRVAGFNRRQPRAPFPATHPEQRRAWRRSIFKRRSHAPDTETGSVAESDNVSWSKGARRRQRRGVPKSTEVDQMKDRAQNTSIYRHMRIGEVNLLVTYRGDSFENLEDFEGMHLKVHSIVYSNKTWAPQEVLLRLRRDVVLDVLGQVSRNFQNIGVFLQQRLDLSSWSGFEGIDSWSVMARSRQDDTPMSVATSEDIDANYHSPSPRSTTPPPRTRNLTPPESPTSDRRTSSVPNQRVTIDESGDDSTVVAQNPSRQANRDILLGNLTKDKPSRKFPFTKGKK